MNPLLTHNLPALLVVIPLIAAPFMVIVRRSRPCWLLSLIASVLTFGVALALLAETLAPGTISYPMGSWEPPLGIEYRVDTFNAFVAVIVALMAVFIVPHCLVGIARDVRSEEHYLFYCMLMLCLAGLLGILVTGDAFNIFVFLEVSSLATYVLIAMGRDRRALVAAYQYLLMGTVGATLYVLGIGILYLETGTLNLADMAVRLPQLGDPRGTLAALAFITVGLTLKIALFPLHLWLPNAYVFAPSAASAFLAATATKVSIYVLMRYFFTIFGSVVVFDTHLTGAILVALSLAAMFIAAGVAIYQRNVKRLLAYSSLSQVGYITLGISLNTVGGLTAATAHLFNHALTKGGMFLLLGCVVARCGNSDFKRLAGLGRTMPLVSFAFVIGGLSLIGVPGTAGFISKWYLVTAAMDAGHWWMAGAIMLSSLLAVIYVWRFVEVAYLTEPPPDHPPPGEAPWSMTVPAVAMIAACVYFGVDASWSGAMAQRAAEALMGGWQ